MIFKNCNVTDYSYEEWKKAPAVVKIKSGEHKTIQKMKTVKQTKSKNDVEKQFHNEIAQFKQQFTAERTLK